MLVHLHGLDPSVSAGYHLFLASFDMKSFSFIRFIDASSTWFRQSINIYVAFKTSVAMSEKLVSSLAEQTIAFRFLKSNIIAITISLGRSYASSICSTFLCQWRNLWTVVVHQKVFALTPRIWCIIRFCEVVEQFLQKPFWFFLRIFSISVRISIFLIVNLCSYSNKNYASVLLSHSKVFFFEERKN